MLETHLKLSKPVCELVDFMGSDVSITDNAKVSFGKKHDKNRSPESTPKERRLIRYLAMHNHWTPIAHVHIEMRLTMPLAIRAQFVKSSVGNVLNEISRRYVSANREYFIPDVIRVAVPDKKQGSGGPHPDSDSLKEVFLAAAEACDKAYEHLSNQNVCPEQARFVLPQGLMTAFSICGSLEFFARLCALRSAPDAQQEFQDIIPEIQKICEKIAPVAFRRRVDALKIQFAASIYVDNRFKALLENDMDKVVKLQDGFDGLVDEVIENMKKDA